MIDLSKVKEHTLQWIENVVIGYNLCPFARKVIFKKQVRFTISDADDYEGLIETIRDELLLIQATPSTKIDTTLIIHPFFLTDFDDYWQFIAVVEELVAALHLSDEIQIASFHPQYIFYGTTSDDAENYTNRSPYPMIHLLRTESVAQALAHYDHPEEIPSRNIDTMNRYGVAYWSLILNDILKS